MTIKSIQLNNFRIHSEKLVDFSDETTIIIGQNGSGKTSIVEALYLGLRGKSFKGSDQDIVSASKDWWRVEINFGDKSKRIIKYDSVKQYSKKQFEVDGKKFYRLPVKNKLPVVIFEPNDLRLLNGSPSRRRDYLDNLIEQTNPEYHSTLLKYERALKQRNNLLKNKSLNNKDVFVWDVALSEYGSIIIQKRVEYIDLINEKINETYSQLAQERNDQISLSYSSGKVLNAKQIILNELSKNIEKDKILGYTTSGPHRDDVIFWFNNSPALSVASRGEIRTIVIALKLLEVEFIKGVFGVKPLILLDDVFSELDRERQKQLGGLRNNGQVVITSTDAPKIKAKDTIIIDLATKN